jgi:hypothetical protein
MITLGSFLTLFLAPSWSWASVDGPIYPWPPGRVAQTLVNILTAQTVPLARDGFGQIANGHINLSGKFFPMPDLFDILERMWEHISFEPGSFGLDGSLPNMMNQISILPIADIANFEGELVDDEFTFHGLLLHNCEDLENIPCYRRIGFARISSDGSIAGSGFYVDGWTCPPWPAEELQTIRLK